MCNNAMTYNRPDTIYYKAARKLLHYGARVLSEERIIPLRAILPFMDEVRSDQLGFEFPQDEETENVEPSVVAEALNDSIAEEPVEIIEKPKEPRKPRELPKYDTPACQ